MIRSAIVNIIGSGNVATHFAPALQKAGFNVAAVFSRTLTHASSLAAKLGGLQFVDTLASLPEANIYILCVKDNAIEQTAQELAATLSDEKRSTALVLHTAGSISLKALAQHFPHAGVIYPLQTFSKEASLDISEIPLFVEGTSADDEHNVTAIAKKLSEKVIPLSSEKRKSLHLAGVFANNFTNHCIALAAEILSHNGIEPDVLIPIVEETVRKLHRLSPAAAQTGPAVRWDANVLEAHTAMLAQCPEMQKIYIAMSESIHQLSERQ